MEASARGSVLHTDPSGCSAPEGLLSLPRAVLLKVASYAEGISDLRRLRLTCRGLREALHSNTLEHVVLAWSLEHRQYKKLSNLLTDKRPCSPAAAAFLRETCGPHPDRLYTIHKMVEWLARSQATQGHYTFVAWLLGLDSAGEAARLRKRFTTLYDRAWVAAAAGAAQGEALGILDRLLLPAPTCPGNALGCQKLKPELQAVLLAGAGSSTAMLKKLLDLCCLPHKETLPWGPRALPDAEALHAALLQAAEAGNWQAIGLLCSYGASPVHNNGKALIVAAQQGRTSFVSELLDTPIPAPRRQSPEAGSHAEPDPPARTWRGDYQSHINAALAAAIQEKPPHTECAALLLKRGATINYPTWEQLIRNREYDLAALFVRQATQLVFQFRTRGLETACRYGAQPVVIAILEFEISEDTLQHGLSVAAEYGQVAVLQLLLAKPETSTARSIGQALRRAVRAASGHRTAPRMGQAHAGHFTCIRTLLDIVLLTLGDAPTPVPAAASPVEAAAGGAEAGPAASAATPEADSAGVAADSGSPSAEQPAHGSTSTSADPSASPNTVPGLSPSAQAAAASRQLHGSHWKAALMACLLLGEQGLVRQLLQGSAPWALTEGASREALALAAKSGSVASVGMLVEHGAELEVALDEIRAVGDLALAAQVLDLVAAHASKAQDEEEKECMVWDDLFGWLTPEGVPRPHSPWELLYSSSCSGVVQWLAAEVAGPEAESALGPYPPSAFAGTAAEEGRACGQGSQSGATSSSASLDPSTSTAMPQPSTPSPPPMLLPQLSLGAAPGTRGHAAAHALARLLGDLGVPASAALLLPHAKGDCVSDRHARFLRALAELYGSPGCGLFARHPVSPAQVARAFVEGGNTELVSYVVSLGADPDAALLAVVNTSLGPHASTNTGQMDPGHVAAPLTGADPAAPGPGDQRQQQQRQQQQHADGGPVDGDQKNGEQDALFALAATLLEGVPLAHGGGVALARVGHDDHAVVRAAAQANNQALLELLLAYGGCPNTALVAAAGAAHTQLACHLMMAHGASPWHRGGAPMRAAALQGPNAMELVTALIAGGADPDGALEQAAAAGCLRVVARLVQTYGADVSWGGEEMPVRVAAQNGHIPVVAYLLDEGASLGAALYGAVLGRQLALGEPNAGQLKAKLKEVVEWLLTRRDGAEGAIWEGGCALQLACEAGDEEVAVLFLG